MSTVFSVAEKFHIKLAMAIFLLLIQFGSAANAFDWGLENGRAFADFNNDNVTDYARVTGNGPGWQFIEITYGRIDPNQPKIIILNELSASVKHAIKDWGYPTSRYWRDVDKNGVPDYCRGRGADPAHPEIWCVQFGEDGKTVIRDSRLQDIRFLEDIPEFEKQFPGIVTK